MSEVALAAINTKICKECLQDKPVDEFHFYFPGKPSGKCKVCHVESERKRQKALWLNNPDYRERHNAYGKMYRKGVKPLKRVEIKGSEKECDKCYVVKPMDEYYKTGSGHRRNTCIECLREQENLKARKSYRENEEYRKRELYNQTNTRLKAKYGITIEQAVETLEQQNHKCANPTCAIEISLTVPKTDKNRAVIDHNHTTGKFRALLCDSCNLLLGRIEKSPQRVDGLILYLNKFNNI